MNSKSDDAFLVKQQLHLKFADFCTNSFLSRPNTLVNYLHKKIKERFFLQAGAGFYLEPVKPDFFSLSVVKKEILKRSCFTISTYFPS